MPTGSQNLPAQEKIGARKMLDQMYISKISGDKEELVEDVMKKDEFF